MTYILPLHKLCETDRPRVGGKCFALRQLTKSGLTVPETVCITTEAYDHFVASTGLRERILLELHRKDFRDMRWEEIWDASLRIRNMFLNKPLPAALYKVLKDFLEAHFADKAVVVRSSASDEDSDRASFAGLHESFVQVKGLDSIIDHIRLVWASLWSDAALLYRQELKLNVETSSMAVLVQETLFGERSGVAFSQSPSDESQLVIEAVFGLNQGLVDGTVEPDRWFFDRDRKKAISHVAADREVFVVPEAHGVRLAPLPEKLKRRPPLNRREAAQVMQLALQAEEIFDTPQDVEWTLRDGVWYVLQSRPITTGSGVKSSDKRQWYLSLSRSYENLRLLRVKLEQELIPQMVQEASQLASQNPQEFSDQDLAGEIERRMLINEKWTNIYYADFIPFAHGIRLFGQTYNDIVRPRNPYEFMDLLGATEMVSLRRNQMLGQLASLIRKNPQLAERLQDREDVRGETLFFEKLNAFIEEFGDLSCPVTDRTHCRQGPDALIRILLEMANHPPIRPKASRRRVEDLKGRFISRFADEKRLFAAELLDLARASYRLRDDDNIYLGRIEAQSLAAVNEARLRLDQRGIKDASLIAVDEVCRALRDMTYTPKTDQSSFKDTIASRVKARQLVGQPAGPGLSQGKARVIIEPSDVHSIQHGEILVCDAVEPNMTFIVPLASAVVERRGGMLIHGAIIAREYGLPCVTGIADATSLIRNGDHLTVDGYLGIVTVS